MFSRITLRKSLLVIHLWLGLFLGFYFSVVGLTGSVLVFQDNLQSWQMPEIAYCPPPSPGASLLPLSTVIARLRASSWHPGDDDLAHILTPERDGGAYRFLTNLRHDDARGVVTVNPYDGRVLRNQPERTTPLGFAHRLHVFLLLDAPGELANGIGGASVTLLLLSGLWLWWPKTRRQLREHLTVRRSAGARRLLLDLHQVFGIYCFGLLLVITITGALFVFPQPVQALIARLGPARVSRKAPKVIPPPGAQRLPIEKLVVIAETVAPEVKISSLNYPTRPTEPFSCYKRSFRAGFLPYINIFIDPYTGKILKVADDRTAPLPAKVPRILAQLHFGLWGGLLIKSIYALAGLAPCGLFITGLLMWWRKKRASLARNSRQRAGPATVS